MTKILMFKTITLIFIISLIYSLSFSQSNFSVKVTTFTCFPAENKNLHLFKNNLDASGHFAFEPGVVLSYEAFFMEDQVSIKFCEGFFYDVTGNPAGFSHLGIRIRILQQFKHSLNVGFGPTLHFRKDRSTIQGYVSENIYNEGMGFQWILSKLSGGIEYNYLHTKKGDYTVSLFHNHHEGFALFFGYRYWFSKEIKHWKCATCPAF